MDWNAFDFSTANPDAVVGEAAALHGGAAAEDMVSGGGSALPTWMIVADGSKDVNYEFEHNGRMVKGSRAGQFRLGKAENPDEYRYEFLPCVVLLVAETQTLWGDGNKILCKGYQTPGVRGSRALSGGVMPAGQVCRACPWNYFSDNLVHPEHGGQMTKQDYCKGGLSLFVWFPAEDPAGENPQQIVASSTAIKRFRTFIADAFESKGARYWAVAGKMETEKVPPREATQQAAYAPVFIPAVALDAEDFSIAERMRTRIIADLRDAMGAGASEALPVVRDAPALTSGSAEDQCVACGRTVPFQTARECRDRGVPVSHPKCAQVASVDAHRPVNAHREEKQRQWVNAYLEGGGPSGHQSMMLHLSAVLSKSVQGWADVADSDWPAAFESVGANFAAPVQAELLPVDDPFDDD